MKPLFSLLPPRLKNVAEFAATPIAAPVAALLAGALNIFAFAPFGWWPLQILSLAFLFLLVAHQPTVARGALIGWAFSFGWLACGFHWMYISMHRYGNLPSWMAVLAVALLAAALALYLALASGLAAWFAQRRKAALPLLMLLILPSCWMLSEWLRGWVLTGLPWVASGYAHSDAPLAGFAPLIGVYGIGWIAAIIAGSLALLPALRIPLVLAATLLLAGFGLRAIEWTAPSGNPISVRLLQGNVPQEMKFAPEQVEASLALYHQMVRAAPADLIATPETALPLLTSQLPPDYLPRFADHAAATGSHIAMGLAVNDGARRYANSVVGFAPDGRPYRYDKHHLVPFGEFVPTGARWFVDMMRIPLGDFTRGAAVQQPFQVKDQRILPNICYEDLFGEEIAAQIAAAWLSGAPQPSVLLNVSNIAWFGDSVALPQHLQISRMRTLETGRPMLRATNTGATAVIDHKGRILARLPYFTRDTLQASVQGYTGWTPYILTGNAVIVPLALAGLAFGWRRSRKAGDAKAAAQNKTR